jgi:hypothetical protein
MAIENLRLTTLQVVNAVQERLGVNKTSTLYATKQARVLVDLLNEVQDELSDFGQWQELYVETTVAVQSSVATYSLDTADDSVVNKIDEIAYSSANSPLQVMSMEDMRRLRRLRRHGEPRMFGVLGVDEITGQPRFEVYPIPGSSQDGDFVVAMYKKPNFIAVSADASTILPFPGQLLVNGLYAKALLEENGGEPTPQFQMAQAVYERQKTEALNRFNADTGTDVYFVPGRGPR